MHQQHTSLPPELFQQAANYLSFRDQRQCLGVCKYWFATFMPAIYRKVHIRSNTQLELFLDSLYQFYKSNQGTFHTGLLVREISLVTVANNKDVHFQNNNSIDVEEKAVFLSQQNFQLLSVLCPELEALFFDTTQWDHIILDPPAVSWKHMKQLAPLPCHKLDGGFLSSFGGGSKLSHLQLSFSVEQMQELVDKVSIVPSLQHLTLHQTTSNTDNKAPTNTTTTIVPLSFSECLQQMHAVLPRLNSLHVRHSITPHQHASTSLTPFSQPSCLQSLFLHGCIDSLDWFEFIEQNYPSLQTLSLTQLSICQFSAKWMWQNALVHLVQSLKSLQSLTLGGRHVPQLFSEAFILELKKKTCPIKELYVDFYTYQAIESCQFLLLIKSHGLDQLRCLRLRVWEQVPGWSGITSSLFQCQKLRSLELLLSKGFMDQYPFTPFLIDYFLKHMPQLQHLSLCGADVQVTYKHFVDLDKGIFSLKSLKLRQCKVENHQDVFLYISSCCPQLDTLSLDMCETDAPVCSSLSISRVPMLESTLLETIQLSSFLLSKGKTENAKKIIGIELLSSHHLPTIIWCEATQYEGTQEYPHYSVCKNKQTRDELTSQYNASSLLPNSMQQLEGDAPSIGIITLQSKTLPSSITLDNCHIPSRYLQQQ